VRRRTIAAMIRTTSKLLLAWKRKILKMFVHSVEDDVYTAKVNSVLKLNLVAKFVAIGVSFRQATSKLYHSVKEDRHGFIGICF
jgi:hypothetical protein